MTKADTIFKTNIRKIIDEGVWSEQARPRYKDGTVANSKYVTGAFAEYDLSKDEFPIITLRPIAIKSAIKENPWNRRNIISLWDYQAFDETDGLLPCAFQTMFDVRRVDGEIYLDATLTQRSNDMLVAHHINAMQYVALQMMIAKHFSWKVGKFFYYINNLHIYDNQFEQAQELLKRKPSDCQPRLVLNVPDRTNFFDIRPEDFVLEDYHPVKPQLKFDLAI